MPINTSKNSDSTEQPALGFFAKRPWIWVFVAFGIMFSAWSVMFSLALKNIPKDVPMAHGVE